MNVKNIYNLIKKNKVKQVATLYYILLSSRKTTITPYLVLEPELEVVREEPPEYEPDLDAPPE